MIGGSNLSEKVFNLIEHCDKQGQSILECLIKGAHKEVPGNLALKSFHDKYFNIGSFSQEEVKENSSEENSGEETRIRNNPDLKSLDLQYLMKDARKILETDFSVGLVGLYVPCESDKLRFLFCRRLKDWLHDVNKGSRGRVKANSVQELDPKNLSVEKMVEGIYKKYYDSLSKERDVIHCIRIRPKIDPSSEDLEKDKEYSNKFWKALEDKFKDFEFKSRLIIVMNGLNEPIFPDSAFKLSTPVFHREIIVSWVETNISEHYSSWGYSAWDKWTDFMEERCICKHSHEMKIDFVYNFLEFTIDLLKDNLIDKEEFLDEIGLRGDYS
jgi:hypothetical protein